MRFASLQAIPKRPDIAVPALLAALADPDTSVRDNAATVLRKYGQVQAEATIPMLVQVATRNENPLVKFRAAEILRAVAPERAREHDPHQSRRVRHHSTDQWDNRL